MKIVLVRHGEAEPSRGEDAMRALTEVGKAQAVQSAAWLRRQIGNVGTGVKLVASPYLRAQQTAAAFSAALELPVMTVEAITPDTDPRRALESLDSHAEGVEWLVVVSHMPLVAALASWLSEGRVGAGQGFGLAEVRMLEVDVPGPGVASLRDRFIPGISG